MNGHPSDPGTPDESARPYGSMPAPSAGEAFAARPEPPQEVWRASMILYAIVAVAALNVILGPNLQDESPRAGAPPADGAEISLGLAAGLIVVLLLVGIGFLVLYILCARKMLEGRNWARVTATVLIGFGVLFGSISLGVNSYNAFALVMQVIGVVLGVAFLFFAWQRPSNEFFKASKSPG